MQKRVVTIIFGLLMLFSFINMVSADVDIDIQSIVIEEPADGIINDKDHILIKATMGNLGDTDWNSGYYVDTYINGKKYGSCSGTCELSDSPVNQGFKAGQLVDAYWASSATDREYLQLGENEIKFHLGFEEETEYVEKSIKFDISEGGLPELDLEITDGLIEISRINGEDVLGSIEAVIKNNGPVSFEDDVIHISFCISSENGELNLGCYGSFIDLRAGFCNPSTETCVLEPGQSITYSNEEHIDLINSRFEYGDYVINYYLDDVNGLENYKDTNSDNNYYYSNFEIDRDISEPPKENQTELILDEFSGIMMERMVKEKLDSRLYNKMKLCSNCGSLPQPSISLEEGDKSAIYNLYLHGQKVTSFIRPYSITQDAIINNPGNVLLNNNKVDGTNSINFLIPSEGNYFQNRYDILTPNQITDIRYKIVKEEGEYGSAYFFILEDDNIFNLDEIVQTFDEIVYDNSNLAGITPVPSYYAIVMPTVFSGLLGGEGTFYMGDNVISLNFGGEKYYDLHGREKIKGSFSHEYVHLLQSLEETGQYAIADNSGFFMEGMADGVSIFNGYRQWIDVIEDPIEPGCSQLVNQHVPHTLGRCIFKHLDQEGFLNEAFFNRLFHLSGDSYFIYTCDASLQDPSCTSELNRLLSFSANQDMSSFMETSLLANLDEVLIGQEAKFASQSEDSCSLIGLRKDGNFCSPEKRWIEQKSADEFCDNNFECSTNLCIDGKCVSSGVWQKFLSWLQKLFG